MKKISVAIDGPAGAGKSSVAKVVAKRAGYLYLDTGAMYRALTWAVLQSRVDLTDEQALKSLIHTTDIHMEPGETDRVFVNGTDVTSPIRSAEVTGHVSAVAALPAVREKLVDLQRQIAARDKADSERRVSPLREADDAVHVDNSRLTAEETADLLYKLIKEREI